MTDKDIKPVYGDPDVDRAQECDEYCDPDCLHHVAGVGWDLSGGARINFHQVDTSDPRLVVVLNVSDDVVATGIVYRQVTPEQILTFARELIELAGGRWELVAAGKDGAR